MPSDSELNIDALSAPKIISIFGNFVRIMNLRDFLGVPGHEVKSKICRIAVCEGRIPIPDRDELNSSQSGINDLQQPIGNHEQEAAHVFEESRNRLGVLLGR